MDTWLAAAGGFGATRSTSRVRSPPTTREGSEASSATNTPSKYVAPASTTRSPVLTGVTQSSLSRLGRTWTGPASVNRATAREAPGQASPCGAGRFALAARCTVPGLVGLYVHQAV